MAAHPTTARDRAASISAQHSATTSIDRVSTAAESVSAQSTTAYAAEGAPRGSDPNTFAVQCRLHLLAQRTHHRFWCSSTAVCAALPRSRFGGRTVLAVAPMGDGDLAGERAEPGIGTVCRKPPLKRAERGPVRVDDAELENQGDGAGDEIRRGVVGLHGQRES